MAKRFSDIEKAGVLKLALDNLTKYRADAATRQSSQITGNGTPKNRIQQKVAIVPFYIAVTAVDAKAKVIVNASKASVEATDNFGKTALAGYYDATPPDGAGSKPQGFKPSRVRTFNPTVETAKYTKSKYTGLYYAKREGVGYSLPIGQKAPGDSEETIQRAIKAAMTSDLNAEPYRRVSFTDEVPPPLK
jgi:hypothetical protein